MNCCPSVVKSSLVHCVCAIGEQPRALWVCALLECVLVHCECVCYWSVFSCTVSVCAIGEQPHALWLCVLLASFCCIFLFVCARQELHLQPLEKYYFIDKRRVNELGNKKSVPLHCACLSSFCASRLMKHEVFEITPQIEILAFSSWIAPQKPLK